MKLMVSREWLREKISNDPDFDTEAGTALAVLEGLGMVVPPSTTSNEALLVDEKVKQLRVALGALMRQLRLHEKQSVAELAKTAVVREDEIRLIEHDPHYVPKPRTLHQLAIHFKVPARQLIQMSGATRTIDREFYNQAVKFAAMSDDLVELNKDELEVLYAFVKYMNEREDLK